MINLTKQDSEQSHTSSVSAFTTNAGNDNTSVLPTVNDSPAMVVCEKHEGNKKIEAFCLADKELLCIDCILADNHRSGSHEVVTIVKAVEKEKAELTARYKTSKDVTNSLGEQNEKIERHLTNLK